MPPEAATFPADACADLLLPATRTLERELSLRVRLLEGYRKLSVQAAEERLLHEVERAVQGPADCQPMLERILKSVPALPRDRVRGPAHPGQAHRPRARARHFSRAELEMLLDEEPDLADSGISDLYTARIRGADRAVIGVLALAGWKGPEFSLRRRSRVGRYLATHIETVLERSFDAPHRPARLAGVREAPDRRRGRRELASLPPSCIATLTACTWPTTRWAAKWATRCWQALRRSCARSCRDTP